MCHLNYFFYFIIVNRKSLPVTATMQWRGKFPTLKINMPGLLFKLNLHKVKGYSTFTENVINLSRGTN